MTRCVEDIKKNSFPNNYIERGNSLEEEVVQSKILYHCKVKFDWLRQRWDPMSVAQFLYVLQIHTHTCTYTQTLYYSLTMKIIWGNTRKQNLGQYHILWNFRMQIEKRILNPTLGILQLTKGFIPMTKGFPWCLLPRLPGEWGEAVSFPGNIFSSGNLLVPLLCLWRHLSSTSAYPRSSTTLTNQRFLRRRRRSPMTMTMTHTQPVPSLPERGKRPPSCPSPSK